ncbi:aquaporin [Elysia marginata]|uniref:Aquaporin n=1 Tax=Elysia marginata TaxID=1093978 RepID=A0AAV4IYV6_9GAST|nr:aquaporin [Elysia marginata]
MSARSSAPNAATQVRRAGVTSHSSPSPSPNIASLSTRRATRELSSASSDNRSTQTSVRQTIDKRADLDLIHSGARPVSPSTFKRLSGISNSSSLESASAEFDGDISIVAPLGKEENTDLYSIQSLPIPTCATSNDSKFTVPKAKTIKSNLPLELDIENKTEPDSLDLNRSFSSEESLQKELLKSSLGPVSTRPILKTLYLTQVYSGNQQALQQTSKQSQGQLATSRKRDLPKSVITPLLPHSQASGVPLISKQTKARRLWDQEVGDSWGEITRTTKESPEGSTVTTSSNCPPRMATSLEDITSLRLWKGIVAEFVGTLLLTLVGCGSCINMRGDTNVTSPVVQIALCFGLSVATVVWAIAHVSGGHVNPAVTCAMLATRKISLVKAVLFIVFQVSAMLENSVSPLYVYVLLVS